MYVTQVIMTMHMLVVDDESAFRFAVGIALRKAGYKVSDATNGKEALKLILDAQKNENPFNLLLIDIQMPEMSGDELIDELRKRNISVPILVVSGFVDKGIVTKLVSRGCKDFIFKPFESKELLKRVEMILHSPRSHSATGHNRKYT